MKPCNAIQCATLHRLNPEPTLPTMDGVAEFSEYVSETVDAVPSTCWSPPPQAASPSSPSLAATSSWWPRGPALGLLMASTSWWTVALTASPV